MAEYGGPAQNKNVFDPAKVAASPKYGDLHGINCYCMMCIAGPGGKTTNIENNERGILQTALQGVIANHQEAALGSDHDPHRKGIYATNSVGDND